MSQVTVIARIEIREGQVDLAKTELMKLVPPTLEEEGCINYNLYQDRTEENLFFFYENWQSDADLDRHLESDHLKAFNESAGDCIDNVDIRRLSSVK